MSLYVAPLNTSFFEKAHYSLEKTLEGAQAVKKDGNSFESLIKLGQNTLKGVQAAFGNREATTLTLQKLEGALSVIDVVSLFSSLHYWISGEFSDDNWCQILASASFTVANVGGFALWLEEVGCINLGTVAASLGNVSVIGGAFKAVVQSLFPIVIGSVACGYGFLAGDAIRNIIYGNPEKRMKGILDLISSVAYVAFYTLLLFAVASVIAYVVLGIIASGFGISSFLYEHFNKKAFITN